MIGGVDLRRIGRRNRADARARQDGSAVRVVVPEDPGSAGKDQALAYLRLLSGFNAKAVRETGSKETRADGIASQFNGSNVSLCRANWNSTFLEELRQFPTGKHDDQVDALAGAFNELVSSNNVWNW